MTTRPPEAQRDLLETAFTPILRRVWSALPSVLAAVFVDVEGECIDYVSSLDPFEAKVSAAHAQVLVDSLRASRKKLGLDQPVALTVSGAARELWARRVTEECLLVVVVLPGVDAPQIQSVLARASREFREELGMPSPAWEQAADVLEVLVRPAVGWAYAPAAYSDQGVRVFVSDVLGRWTEADGGDEIVCFRVRTEEGQELTLVHDPRLDGWRMRA
jgi:predicted regulator of Ras-like GTPase activity (Roadblock/LC7/MglB family)